MDEALKGYGTALFTRHLGMSSEEAIKICDGAFKELSRRSVHTYVEQCVGQSFTFVKYDKCADILCF